METPGIFVFSLRRGFRPDLTRFGALDLLLSSAQYTFLLEWFCEHPSVMGVVLVLKKRLGHIVEDSPSSSCD